MNTLTKALINQATESTKGGEAEEGLALATIALVHLLDEIAGPTCGHGFRIAVCPYCKQEQEA